ncbi:hypothetical protein J2125_003924 [Erwinia toletana]|uniref:DUF3158 family protein n=1 Tax=Winslowiella toletana TaxID=92490 RepID=A0ABS4PDL8_9GAMM|nr:DUF3158 family protein [Winslowiella toletana]MBP2170732.1 hypothetical protein [Winslowiella toletana]
MISWLPLTDSDYDLTARKSSLKGLLMAFKGKGEVAALIEEINQTRDQLCTMQNRLVQSVYTLPVRYLPLILTRNPARSGATFLRWRNLANNRSGTPALQEILQQPETTSALKNGLMTIEYERQIINSQVSVMTFILRQLRSINSPVILLQP